MLRTLEAFGFEWDGEVLYQSTRREAYRAALDFARAAGRLFACSCSRKELAAGGEESPGYPGHLPRRAHQAWPHRAALPRQRPAYPLRRPVPGRQEFDLHYLRRRGGRTPRRIASYQLAVVVDDAFQGVTRVVRGADLLSSTPWQMELQAALALPRPIYGHLPLLIEPDGTKLSKSKRSVPLDPSQVAKGLTATLTHLSQIPPPELAVRL